jgi:ribosome-associated toxin RatA of RatAB toxin-antitoxin module
LFIIILEIRQGAQIFILLMNFWLIVRLRVDYVKIEYNLKYQGIDHFQMFNEGPCFGGLTDEVLTEIFGKNANSRG